MEFAIIDQTSAKKALDYFNDFHDGFIKHLQITSQEYFEPDGGLVVTGEFLLAIDFCHYNYQNHFDNKQQIIQAIFQEVYLISLETSKFEEFGWFISEIAIDQTPDKRFKLKVNGIELFDFSNAIFKEI